MALHTLSQITDKKKRRLGQGHGSGRVKTSGRGTKGQKARNSVPLTFEGGALPLIKRLPFLRGKMKNNPVSGKPIVLNLSDLNTLPKDSAVSVSTLAKHHLVNETDAKRYGIKILGGGELTSPLKFSVPVSEAARVKIEKVKGTIETAA